MQSRYLLIMSFVYQRSHILRFICIFSRTNSKSNKETSLGLCIYIYIYKGKEIWWLTDSILQRRIKIEHNREMDKRLNSTFLKKIDFGIGKNYRGITLSSKAATVYSAVLRNHTKPDIEKILRKNQNGFRRKRSMTPHVLTIRRILGVPAKNLKMTLLFGDFSHAFESIHRGKME